MDLMEFFEKIMADAGGVDLSRTTRAFCRNIIKSLDYNSLISLRNIVKYDWYLENCLEERIREYTSVVERKKIQYNKTWRAYLNDMRLHRSGKVVFAREQLRKLFYFLEWRAQCQLLEFFLRESTKCDRIWALKAIRKIWPLIEGKGKKAKERWIAVVFDLWEIYQEEEAALVLLDYAEENCILEQQSRLVEQLGYQKVALRLGKNPEYEVDRTQVSDLEWLYIMVKLQRHVDRVTCELVFSEVLMEVIVKNESLVYKVDKELSFIMDRRVGLAVWCLGQLKYPELIMEFYKWDKALQDSLAPHYRTSCGKDCWSMMCREAHRFFPFLRDYEHNVLERMVSQYPMLRNLIDEFQLEFQYRDGNHYSLSLFKD